MRHITQAWWAIIALCVLSTGAGAGSNIERQVLHNNSMLMFLESRVNVLEMQAREQDGHTHHDFAYYGHSH